MNPAHICPYNTYQGRATALAVREFLASTIRGVTLIR